MFSRPQRDRRALLARRVRFEQLEERLPFAVGDLDASFGAAGLVRDAVSQVRTSGESVQQLIVRDDGGFYVVGNLFNGRGFSGAVWSFQSNGSVQSSFGKNGQATVPLASGDEGVQSAAVQPDGKIIVAGSYRNTPLQSMSQGTLLRLNVDGSLDSSFAADGQFIHATPIHSTISQVVVRPTGEIVALARSGGEYELIQLKSTGQIDDSFSVSGQLSEKTEYSPDDMLLLPDGSVVIASVVAPDSDTRQIVLVKHSNTGARDLTFGVNGVLRLTVAQQMQNNHYESPLRLHSASDGTILLGGTSRVDDISDYFVAKLTTTGRLVRSFGIAGIARITLAGTYGTALHDLQAFPDGHLAIIGNLVTSSTADSGLFVRYLTSSGAPDTTAVTDGVFKVNNSFGNVDGYARLSGSRLIHAMNSSPLNLNDMNIQVLAFAGDGIPDASFGNSGKVTYNAENSWTHTVTHDLIQLPDDSYLALSTNSVDRPMFVLQPMLVRYRHNGTIDSGYGTNGRIVLDNDGVNTFYYPMQLKQTSHGIYIVLNDHQAVRIARLNAEYELDSSFGDEGWLSWSYAGQLDHFSDVLLTADAVYVAGRSTGQMVNGQFVQYSAVHKLNWQGAIDTSFGTDGRVHLPWVPAAGSNVQLAIQSTGKLIVMSDNHPDDPLFSVRLTRLLSNGAIDAAFGNQGSRKTNLWTGGALDLRRKVEVLSDDSLLAFGVDSSLFHASAVLTKYDADGNIDSAFGGDGSVTIDQPSLTHELYDLKIDSQQRIIAAVADVSQRSTGTIVARYLPNGQLDTAFSHDGMVVLKLTSFSDRLDRLAISDRDDIILAGSQVTLRTTDSLIVRLIGSESDTSDWHNGWSPEDVSGDRMITAIDALLLVNRLNTQASAAVPAIKNDVYFLDVNDDGFITSLDALLVINHINNRTAGGEGESSTADESRAAIPLRFALEREQNGASLAWVDEEELRVKTGSQITRRAAPNRPTL